MLNIEVKNVFHNLGIWASKDADFNLDFKNINLPLSQNAPKNFVIG
jgi:hypothetical protein